MSNTEEFVNLLHKEIEQFVDEGYAKLDQQECEMRELGLINYGDSSYYIQNPDEYEKDRKICELENEVERLEHRLEVAEKAFNNLYDKFMIVTYNYAKMDTIPSKLHFKEQAEKELKGE